MATFKIIRHIYFTVNAIRSTYYAILRHNVTIKFLCSFLYPRRSHEELIDLIDLQKFYFPRRGHFVMISFIPFILRRGGKYAFRNIKQRSDNF